MISLDIRGPVKFSDNVNMTVFVDPRYKACVILDVSSLQQL